MPEPDWFEDHDDLITKRPPVEALTANNVRALLNMSVEIIRRKDLRALKGLLSPKFVIHTFRPYGTSSEPLRLTLGGYMVWASGWFQGSDTSQYSMEVESISLISATEAIVMLTVVDPGNEVLYSYLGPKVRETVHIGLHKNRPVLLKVTAEGPRA